jgi:hypothetical protein
MADSDTPTGAPPRRRGGRPRKHADGLAKSVSFRLPPAELATWLAKVEASGLSASDFFRELVLTNRTQVIARARPSADTTRLLFLVNKAGNNLNQLAHRANAAHQAGKVDEATYAGILSELSLIRRALLLAVED